MTSSIMQPTFLPWLGYFDMIDMVNHFVFLDNVQLVKRSWQVRNRIKIGDNEHFLTIPVSKTCSRDDMLISQTVMCESSNWRKKHLNTLYHAYSKTKHFEEVYSFIQNIYDQNINSLSDFNIYIITSISQKIGIKTNFLRASQLKRLSGTKDDLLSAICIEINSTEYLSPVGSSAYLEEYIPGGKIVQNGIQLYYHKYAHPFYKQKSQEFLPYMCILDLLFNVGFAGSLSIIRQGRDLPVFYSNFSNYHPHVQCA